MKGYRTLAINGALIAAAAVLKFVAGINFTDYGIDANTAVIIAGVANFALRFVTTTPVGAK